MVIRLRFGARDIRPVDVRDARCPTLACFYPSRHVIYSAAGMSGCSSKSTEQWECGTRERRGCPAHTQIAEPPRYQKQRGVWAEILGN